MTALQGIGVFAGIPAVILLLIALPLYGERWYRWLTRRRGGSHPPQPEPRSSTGDDPGTG